jgi:MraZ protein
MCGNVEENVEDSHRAVFKGTYRHRIDAKGRLPVPAPFRRALLSSGDGALVATLVDRCVAVYPGAEWRRLEEQLRRLPAFSRQAKALTRNLAARATDCALDVQGRILIPPALRAGAGLSGEAVVIGVLDRIEIWSPSAWDDFLRESEQLLEDVTLDVAWPLPFRSGEGEPGRGSTGKP